MKQSACLVYHPAMAVETEQEPILPPREEWAELVPPRDGITWDRGADIRTFAAAGTALLLQVAHPTVGAGVHDFSTFASDPWGRLWRTLDFTTVLIFGGPEAAAEMGARIRSFHKVIKGTKPDGSPYHALEPEAYTWVHLTLAEGIMRAHERFGRPFTRAQQEQLWAEWRPLGRFLGIRWRDMPETYDGYREFVEEIIAERLERNAAVDEVYEALTSTPPPPSAAIGERAWGVASRPMMRFAGLATIGLLPPQLRGRLGLELTRSQRLELRALGAAARSLTPLMPRSLRNVAPGYLRWRRKPIARGDVASPAANPHVAPLLEREG
jgi:uncharacterized protein (DUF2236 family)